MDRQMLHTPPLYGIQVARRLLTEKKKTPLEKVRLKALIAEATVDAYGESEQRMGFYTMFDDHLDVPFATTILGVSVIVEGVDMIEDDQIVAICRRGRSRQLVPILELPLPTPRPAGAEWILKQSWNNIFSSIQNEQNI